MSLTKSAWSVEGDSPWAASLDAARVTVRITVKSDHVRPGDIKLSSICRTEFAAASRSDRPRGVISGQGIVNRDAIADNPDSSPISGLIRPER
jgi:hypothetical protein